MAYTETYTVKFTNEQNQNVVATIYKKDGPIVTVQNYMAVAVELNDRSEGQTKYDSTIISRELTLTLWTETGNDITWETFIADEHDTWQIAITIDGKFYFHGFITPDEGNSPFQDKPYEVTFRATNGLSLLKDIPLVKIDGTNFTGIHSLIEYISAALWQTGLDLSIITFCNYYTSGMQNRRDGLQYDMFSQTYLDYRTFLQDPIKFVSCYDTLMIILDKFCRLEYWNSFWLIKNISELQFTPDGKHYATTYSSIGVAMNGFEDNTNQYQIGKSVDLYPINEDQQIYSRFAIKSAKTKYYYNILPTLLDNEGLGILGIEIGSGDISDDNDEDQDGDTSEIIGTYKAYHLYGWVHKKKFLAEVDPVTNAYIKVEYDLYNREKARYYVIEKDVTSPIDIQTANYIRNTTLDFYVAAGDKIDISITARINQSISGSFRPASVLIFTGGDPTDNSNYWVLDPFGKFQGPGGATQAGGLAIDGNTVDTKQWNTASFQDINIPVNGTLIVKLCCAAPGSTGEYYFKDLTVNYKVFVGGSYFSAKGDYWIRDQNKVFPDISEEEVRISDSQRKITKGALLTSDGSLTAPDWYRFGNINNFSQNPLFDHRHFKELLNIARFNHSYRRMYALEGTFNGLNCAAQNDQLNKYPIRFDKRYRLVDLTPARDFVLVPPLKMDLIKGWVTLNLVEVVNTAVSGEGTMLGDSSSFNYIFDNNG
jgi:hypothetical protein